MEVGGDGMKKRGRPKLWPYRVFVEMLYKPARVFEDGRMAWRMNDLVIGLGIDYDLIKDAVKFLNSLQMITDLKFKWGRIYGRIPLPEKLGTVLVNRYQPVSLGLESSPESIDLNKLIGEEEQEDDSSI